MNEKKIVNKPQRKRAQIIFEAEKMILINLIKSIKSKTSI